jgi:dTMP kinase
VGKLIVVEGIDGAGKRTLVDGLADVLGGSVVRRAFPRYGRSVTADLIHDGLHGRLGGLGDEAYGMAVLYALDRHGAADDLRRELAEHDVVLVDRYVASNAAFGAARLRQDARGEFVAWVHQLEIGRLGLPVPHAQVLLRVPVEVAAARAAHRERTETGRGRDTWEADGGLQARTAAVYDGLAAAGWLAPWHVVDGTTTPDLRQLAAKLRGTGRRRAPSVRLPPGAVQAVRLAVGLLVGEQFVTLAKLSAESGIRPEDLAAAVRRHGTSLVRPPEQAFDDLDPIECERAGKHAYAIDFSLWSKEEGPSDLTMQLDVVEAMPGVYSPVVRDIRVL